MEQYKPYVPLERKPFTYEDYMALPCDFFKEGHVICRYLKDINAACGCSTSSCIEKRYIKTEKKEDIDVVKMIDGKVTVVMNDVVIKVEENNVEEIVTIESNKKVFSI